MITEEEHLIESFGKQQPFRVPEGYFDNLAANIMANLPEHTAKKVALKPAWQRYLRPILAAAASVVVILFTSYIFFNRQETTTSTLSVNTSYDKNNSYTAIDQAADYAMMDNEDMYAYVAGY